MATEARSNGRKPTCAQHDERVTLCRNLLGLGYSDGQIKSVVTTAYGVSWRTVFRYLARAREQIREELGQDLESLRADAIEFYRGILLSDDARASEKIKARERMDKLLGLEAPMKVAETDSAGHDIFTEDEREQAIERLARRIEDRRQLGFAEPSEN